MTRVGRSEPDCLISPVWVTGDEQERLGQTEPGCHPEKLPLPQPLLLRGSACYQGALCLSPFRGTDPKHSHLDCSDQGPAGRDDWSPSDSPNLKPEDFRARLYTGGAEVMRLGKAMMGKCRTGGEEQKPGSRRRQLEREMLRGGRQPWREAESSCSQDLASLRPC